MRSAALQNTIEDYRPIGEKTFVTGNEYLYNSGVTVGTAPPGAMSYTSANLGAPKSR